LTYNPILHVSVKFTSQVYIIHKLSLPLFLNKNVLCRNYISHLILIYFYFILTNKTFSYWNGVNDAAHKAMGKANAEKTPIRMHTRLSVYCANESLEILRVTHKELQTQMALQATGIISLSLKLFLSSCLSFCGLFYDYSGRAV
jgi:hypothetical protein